MHRIGRTGRAKRHGVAYTFVASVTDQIKMDEIASNQKMDLQVLKYDEDGCLILLDTK